ncbi:sodium/glutamate symporter [Thalassotalea euphylliae]|uniref:sodium/glutamate symporter n=1 Tax=Thalassotalea euphylliae TaxID=1655234 RepID=UPI0036444428
MDLNARQTIIVAILVLFLGRYLNKKLSVLNHFNIPEPVTGGVLISIVFAAIYTLFDITVQFSLLQRDALLIVFFTCVGLSAKFSTLKQGGTTLVILLVLAVIYLVIQNLTGIGIAVSTGLPSEVGVLGGSVSLSGGHGTAVVCTFITTFVLLVKIYTDNRGCLSVRFPL